MRGKNLLCFTQRFTQRGYKMKNPLKIKGLISLLAVGTGLEPATPCVTGTYSNQLNYPTIAVKRCKSNPIFQLHKLFM